MACPWTRGSSRRPRAPLCLRCAARARRHSPMRWRLFGPSLTAVGWGRLGCLALRLSHSVREIRAGGTGFAKSRDSSPPSSA